MGLGWWVGGLVGGCEEVVDAGGDEDEDVDGRMGWGFI